MPEFQKTRERRLRRAADRQGMRLVKSRRRDPLAIDYGHYELVEDHSGRGIRVCRDLDEVEAYLNRRPP